MKTDLEPWKSNLEPWKTIKTNLNHWKPIKTEMEPWKTNLEPSRLTWSCRGWLWVIQVVTADSQEEVLIFRDKQTLHHNIYIITLIIITIIIIIILNIFHSARERLLGLDKDRNSDFHGQSVNESRVSVSKIRSLTKFAKWIKMAIVNASICCSQFLG